MHTKDNCECYRCKYGEAAYKKWVKEETAKHGFIVEMVTHDCNCPNHTNYHTHGIFENFKHLDFQICFPLPENLIGYTFHELVNAIKAGKKFEVGIKYPDILRCEIEFINAIEDLRPVLRLLVPDKYGKYPPGPFGKQLTMTGVIND
jgi:hypothetical protein